MDEKHNYWKPLNDRKTSWLYRVIYWFVWLFSPKYKISGEENLAGGPCIIVGNHSHMYGPIAGELYTPGKHYVWCIGEMMKREEVAAYAFQDFWSIKPRRWHWFFHLLSHLIAPLSAFIFHNAHTVAVYHDARLLTTYRESIALLQEGNHIVIFPEHYDEHNHIVHDFQDKFIDLARFYYKKTGVALRFVPMYLAPPLSEICYGEPIEFNPAANINDERRRICNALMDRITDMAEALPEHKVVPYPNISKKYYGSNHISSQNSNVSPEADIHEKTGS